MALCLGLSQLLLLPSAPFQADSERYSFLHLRVSPVGVGIPCGQAPQVPAPLTYLNGLPEDMHGHRPQVPREQSSVVGPRDGQDG